MLANHQTKLRISVAQLERFLRRVQRLLKLPAESVGIAFVTDGEMQRLNRTYRRKNKPTDVLSFPATKHDAPQRTQRKTKKSSARNAGRKPSATHGDATGVTGRAARRRSGAGLKPSATLYIGDIAIAPGVARRNARRDARSLHDELRILILHGVLHLVGYDHETDRGEMDRIERCLRRRLGLDSEGRRGVSRS